LDGHLKNLTAVKKDAGFQPGWVALAIVVLTVAAYSSVGSLGFVTLDDPQYILDNPHVNQGLSWAGLQWAFTSTDASNWHPLTWISHMLDVELFGLRAGPHHWENLFLHVINALFLFMFLLRTTGAVVRSGLVAALFALHPLHVESVAWISERKDVLSTLFFLLTLLAYATYVRKPITRWYLVVIFLLVMGLMVKPMLVTLPFVLVLLDFWPLRRVDPSTLERTAFVKLLVEKLPLLVLAIGSSVITLLVQRQGGAVNTLVQTPLDLRLSNVLVSYVKYMGNMVWPADLAVFYPMPQAIPLWQPVCAFMVLGAITFYALKAAQRYPYLPVGWFWYLGTLVPVIGIVQVGAQGMADRYTYLPLTGLFIVFAWGGYDLLVRGAQKRGATTILITVMLLALGTATWFQVQHWRDAKTLWMRALAVTNGNYRAHVAYGSLLAEEGKNAEAANHFSAAIRIQPNYAEAHNKLGSALMESGRVDEALSHFEQALQLRPDLGIVNTNIGNVMLEKGRVEEAERYLRAALDQDPDNPIALNSLGSVMDELGRDNEAIALYRKSLLARPGFSAAHNNLAAAFAKKGQIDDAVEQMSAALSAEPRNAKYHYNFAVLVLQQGNVELAREHLKESLAINPSFETARQALQTIGDG
jgi:tetratricopeptide (TPR) repeat protein